MAFVFAWDAWNKEHVTKHGCNAADAKYIIEHAAEPFPREVGDGKYLVWGQTDAGAYIQVIFVFKLPSELLFSDLGFMDWIEMIDYPATVAIYICHAMPMKATQVRQFRRLRSK